MCFLTADAVSSPAVQREPPDVVASQCYVNPCNLEITLPVTWVEAGDGRFENECCFLAFFLFFFFIWKRLINQEDMAGLCERLMGQDDAKTVWSSQGHCAESQSGFKMS